MANAYNLITVLGPTASGKTALAVKIAGALNTEIISADSRQVYIGMDIGTGKDRDSYIYEGRPIPCRLLDLITPTQDFSVFDFQRHFYQAFESIHKSGRMPVLAGGTGLYLDCVLRGYTMAEVPENPDLRKSLDAVPIEEILETCLRLNPRMHNNTDTKDKNRAVRALEILLYQKENPDLFVKHPQVRSLTFGIGCPREKLRKKIRERLKKRIEMGMIEETARLKESGIPWERFEYFGLEYRYTAQYLQGKLTLPEMEEVLETRIGQFAKRQETWFRKMEREGVAIIWIAEDDDRLALKILHDEGII